MVALTNSNSLKSMRDARGLALIPYVNKVKIPFLVIALFLSLPIALADSNEVVSGDYLFVRAQVVGCGSRIRIVEYGQVTESGEVTLFGDIYLM